MRVRRAWYENYVKPWEDRVAGSDEKFEGVDVDVDRLVEDAVAAARTVIECTVTPLAEMFAAMPRTVDIEWKQGYRRARRRHPHHRRHDDWDW